jgi:protein involved in polysaccharide export with SLBB domain
VDEDCDGNYPFEVNVFLRLGERGEKAWFHPEELLGFRFHRNSLRVYGGVLENPRVVGTMTALLERRRFAGWNERRRRQILGKLHRRAALRLVRKGDEAGCRSHLLKAAAANPFSVRLLASMPLAFLAPGALRRVLPPLRETHEAPRLLGIARGLVLALLPLLAACASARTSRVVVVAPETVQSAARYQKEYVLVPDDQIEVVVQRVPEVSRNVLIRPDGFISLPLMGDVQAAGLTPRELTARLTERFGKRLIDPEVAVIATRVRPAMVYVAGEVGAQIAVPLRDAPTVMQAIALAGGFRRSASEGNVAIIRLSPEGRLQAIRIRRQVQGQPASYMALRLARLQPDDLVFVPENGRSQFSRFVDDIINKPLSGINSLASPLINYRLFEVLGKQSN